MTCSYNARHKLLKQEPSILNFLQISDTHSSHLCFHSNVPLSSPNVEPRVFWSTEMTANPNQHWRGENHTSVLRFGMRIVANHLSPTIPLSPNGDQDQFSPNNIHTLSRDKL